MKWKPAYAKNVKRQELLTTVDSWEVAQTPFSRWDELWYIHAMEYDFTMKSKKG
jgi:hypothetical protein